MVHDPHKSSDIDRDYQLQAGFNQPNRETNSCKLRSSRTIPCHAGDMDKPGRTPSIPRTITVSGTGRRVNVLPTLWMIRKKKHWLSANFISFRALWGRDRAPNATRLTVRTLLFCHSIQSNPTRCGKCSLSSYGGSSAGPEGTVCLALLSCQSI